MINFYHNDRRDDKDNQAKTTMLKTNFCLVMHKTMTNFCWVFDKIPQSNIRQNGVCCGLYPLWQTSYKMHLLPFYRLTND